MKYADKLKHPKWQKKRLEVLSRDEFRCQLCWDNTTMLHVHHKYYKKGQDPWKYKLKAFITLCSKCHDKFHKKNFVARQPYVEPEPYVAPTNENIIKNSNRSDAAKDFFEKYRDT